VYHLGPLKNLLYTMQMSSKIPFQLEKRKKVLGQDSLFKCQALNANHLRLLKAEKGESCFEHLISNKELET